MEPIRVLTHPGPRLWQVHTHKGIPHITTSPLPIVISANAQEWYIHIHIYMFQQNKTCAHTKFSNKIAQHLYFALKKV